MSLRNFRIGITVLLWTWCSFALAVTTTVNTDAAAAVLKALQNPNLSLDEARAIAKLHGNHAATKKLQEFKIAADDEVFASALLAAAQGRPPKSFPEQNYQFDMVKAKVPRLLELLVEMKENPDLFQGAVARRIDLYSPEGVQLNLNGYVVAAGDGGGYAFGDTDFFINIGMIDELVVIKSVTTHELYHAVQGTFTNERRSKSGVPANPTSSAQLSCQAIARLFDSIYREGSAVEVADETAIKDAKSPIGIKMRTELAEHVRRVQSPVILLEMSVIALTTTRPIEYDDVYNVGFLGSGPLYGISYVMAKAISDNDGKQGLASFARKPAYEFLLHYTQLPLYGADALHPLLGPHTIQAATHLSRECM